MSIFHTYDPALAVEKLNCRLSVFGAGRVGKSKIVDRIVSGTYYERYRPTVEDYHEIEQKFQGVSLTIEIVDTSGTNQFPDMRKLNIKRSNLLMLVYDVSLPSTFTEVQRLYEIARCISETCFIIIVGAKSDLLPTDLDLSTLHGGDEVTKFLNQKLDKYAFHRLCSAKNNVNIDLVLETGLTSLFPDIIKRHRTSTATWCNFRQHNVNNALHDPHSRYGFRCVCRQISSYVMEKLRLEL